MIKFDYRPGPEDLEIRDKLRNLCEEFLMPNRSETLQWMFSLSKEQVEEHKDILADICFDTPIEELSAWLRDGDTMRTTYTIHINYLGAICKNLNAIIKLQKAGAIVKVDEDELNHGHCLIRDVFKAIDKLNKKAKKKAKKTK